MIKFYLAVKIDLVLPLIIPHLSITLTATVKTDDATEQTVVRSSSDGPIAKVENGKAKAIKIGSATVAAKSASFSFWCEYHF